MTGVRVPQMTPWAFTQEHGWRDVTRMSNADFPNGAAFQIRCRCGWSTESSSAFSFVALIAQDHQRKCDPPTFVETGFR